MEKQYLYITKRNLMERFREEFLLSIVVCCFVVVLWFVSLREIDEYFLVLKTFIGILFVGLAICLAVKFFQLKKINELITNGQIVMARITPEMVVYYNNSIEIFATYGSGDTRRVFREICPVKKEKLYRIGKALENMYCIPVVMDPENELMYVVPLKEIIWFIENRRLSPSEKLDVIREINLLELMS